MRIIAIAYTLFIIAPVSIILWLIDRFIQPFLPSSVNSIFFLIIAVVSPALGILIHRLAGYRVGSDINLDRVLNRLLDGINGRLSGEIRVHSQEDRIYEVFYKRLYTRPPSLKLWQEKDISEIIEQRSDGFKIKGHDSHRFISWEAKGEFAHLNKAHKTLSYSYSVFGLPNKKYTYDLFVLMPFALSLKPVYDGHIKKVAKTLNLSIARADDFFSQESIMHEVWSAITQASILIADCIGKNPNVFYEIGIAHTIGKPVILITQNQDDVPFDLRHICYIQYDCTPSEMIKFENALIRTISEVRKDLGKGIEK